MKKIKILKNWIRVNRDFIVTLFESRKKHNLINKIDVETLYEKVHNDSKPCFVLSTGRCGTELLTQIFNNSPNLKAYHKPKPELIYYSKIAYEYNKFSPEKAKNLEKVIDCSRYDYIRDAYLLEKKYVETNNCITFFAYQLANLYPQSTFIHLVRHPIKFINSGLPRKWYTGHNSHDEGRIKSKNINFWKSLNREEKIAWQWVKTHNFITKFKQSIDKTRVLTIKSENLFKYPKTTQDIFNFLNLPSPSSKKLRNKIKKPINSQKKNRKALKIDFDELKWKDLKEIMDKFDYQLQLQ